MSEQIFVFFGGWGGLTLLKLILTFFSYYLLLKSPVSVSLEPTPHLINTAYIIDKIL